MDAFSYLSVLLSIILGLAMTQILQGYRLLILHRHRVRLAVTPMLWSGLLLLFATQAWWASFGLRNHADWSFAGFTVVLVQMAFLYLMAAVVLPDLPAEGMLDLAAHHRDHARVFFALLLGVLAASMAKDRVIDGHWPGGKNLLFHATLAATAIAGMILRGARAQLVLVLATAAGFALYVSTLFAQLH